MVWNCASEPSAIKAVGARKRSIRLVSCWSFHLWVEIQIIHYPWSKSKSNEHKNTQTVYLLLWPDTVRYLCICKSSLGHLTFLRGGSGRSVGHQAPATGKGVPPWQREGWEGQTTLRGTIAQLHIAQMHISKQASYLNYNVDEKGLNLLNRQIVWRRSLCVVQYL